MSERILGVDDEPAVLRLVSCVLRRKGFEVIEAAGASQALTAVEESSLPVKLLLSDVDMPSIDGYELADTIKSKRPNCRILLMSGKAVQDPARPYPFLQKPFIPHVLVECVTQVMQNSSLSPSA